MIMIVLRLGCQHCMARFRPDFLGLGVQKGGTTSLDAMLRQHPDVLLPDRKELQFFSLHYNLGEAWYGGRAINPQLVSPLKPARQRSTEEIPSPSILSEGRRAQGLCPKPSPKLVFSPFNQVKLIPPKEQTEMFGRYREPDYDDLESEDDDNELDSDEDNEVLRQSLQRARM